MSSANHRITFVLPAGMTLSGVTTWSTSMASRLAAVGQPTGLIQHALVPPPLVITIPDQLDRVVCQNQASPFDFFTRQDLADYQTDYRRLLPGTIIPNGGSGTYATCALISRRQPEKLRVLGIAHADEPDFYEWLSYYEPIIHKFVAVSRDIALKLKPQIPHRQSDIHIRPYAVEASSSLSRSYTPPAEPICLMYAGRLIERQKRVSDLLKLVEALEALAVDFHLTVVGDGPAKGDLVQALRSMGKDTYRRVTFVGRIAPDRMASTWQQADICILVSEYEGTSVSMLEAMAQGCVPVVTKVSGTGGVIRAGENGFIVPVGDTKTMAEIIKALADDRSRLTALGMAAHNTIAQDFSYEQYLRWFLDLNGQCWQQSPREWPTNCPLLRHPTVKERVDNLSGEQLGHLVPAQKLIKAIAFKTATQPGFKWLSRFRRLRKEVSGRVACRDEDYTVFTPVFANKYGRC